MERYRIIVGHPGKQHSFRLAAALKRKNILFRYITTVYDKNGLMMRIVKSLIGKDNAKRASMRKCSELDDDDVMQYCELRSLITLLLLRIDKSKKYYSRWSRYVSASFGQKVAKYAVRNKADMVVMYDSNAAECFEYLKKYAPGIICVMDVSHSNRLYEKKLFERDMEILPEWAENLKKEKAYLWETDLDFIRKENALADYFLVPSGYVKKTLAEYGADPERILVTPYGVDTDQFGHAPTFTEKEKDEDICFLFVGNATEMKGFGHLLKALETVNQSHPGVKLHFVGGTLDPQINEQYGNHVISYGYLHHDQMREIYAKADVMVFPSLSEGMTLSGLEALCCGVPLICTDHSGVNDLIKDGINGFVVNVSNAEQIADRMIWFLEHKEAISGMKENAHNTGMQYSWEKYYSEIGEKIERICKGN